MSSIEAVTKPSSQPAKGAPLAPLAKGQFRCFRCRGVFLMREGDWFAWNSMEVHLCKGCDVKTRGVPERGGRS